MNTICLYGKSKRGIALMVVMIAIFVLSVLAGAFAYMMKVETKLAMNTSREASDVWECGESGVAAAKAILSAYINAPNINRNQKWAGGPGDDFETNGPLAEVSLDAQGNLQMGGITFPFYLKITDLGGKININMAGEKLLSQALTMAGVDGGEIPAITSAIIDWIDQGDETSINGAESSYYQTLNPPHYAKNAPMDDLSELLLVRGITREMYEGTDVTNRIPSAFQKRDRFGFKIDEPVHVTGLKDIFTTLSNGNKINLNTTTAEVLQALGLDEATAQEFIRQRDEAPFRTRGDLPRQPPQLKAVVDGYGDVRSSIFEVQITPKAGGFKRKFYAIIGPGNNQREMQVLSFYWKWNE